MNKLIPNINSCTNDFTPSDNLIQIQTERLQQVFDFAYANVPFYAKHFSANNVVPGHIKSLQDLAKLPLLDKSDLQSAYPLNLFASQLQNTASVYLSHLSKLPFAVAYSRSDIAIIDRINERIFCCCGITTGDIIQNSGHNTWFAGINRSEIYGVPLLSAVNNNDIAENIKFIQDFGITALCSTPGYVNYLVEYSAGLGIALHQSKLRLGIIGGEQWSDEMRERIEKVLAIKTFDLYGLSEINGTGVAVECEQHRGLHIFEDYFYPEIINPDNGKKLPDGEIGELVITTLGFDAMPLIRYRTGDITKIILGKCDCGRTLRRLERITGRIKNSIVIRGVNIYQSVIESALLSVEGTMPHYNIVLYTENGLDCIEVDVEITEQLFSDKVREMEMLQQRLAEAIKQAIGIEVRLKLVAPQTINRNSGNTRRIFDHRQR
jgi:phenylacetate-CoA ligase